MKHWTNPCFALGLSTLLAGCVIGNGTICGPQTPRAYCDREAYEKLTNPKGYGEFFTKTGMTRESWREDWVACGGRDDGAYGIDAPSGSTTAALTAARDKKVDELSGCMQSRGYEFHR
jgi:hypothetical protein